SGGGSTVRGCGGESFTLSAAQPPAAKHKSIIITGGTDMPDLSAWLSRCIFANKRPDVHMLITHAARAGSPRRMRWYDWVRRRAFSDHCVTIDCIARGLGRPYPASSEGRGGLPGRARQYGDTQTWWKMR